MGEQQSIRDELADLIEYTRTPMGGQLLGSRVQFDGVADVILASPVIRRIQADALRDAADALTGDISNLNPAHPVELAYINCTRIDQQELRHRADRIEKGDSA